MSELTGKRALVTGASRGIGAAIALALADKGADVAITYERSADRAAEVVKAIEEKGRKALAIQADSADPAAGKRSVDEAVKALGGLDVLVNNAGIAGTGPAIDTATEEFDRILATNLRGVWLVSRAAARRWRDAKRPGIVLNIASILGLRVIGGTAPYAVSKAGVVQLTQALALEWARFGIRVNGLAPGYIATDINADFFATEAGQQMIRRMPLRRLGRPEDLDGAFLLLATDASAWMTGVTLPVDGGHLVSPL